MSRFWAAGGASSDSDSDKSDDSSSLYSSSSNDDSEKDGAAAGGNRWYMLSDSEDDDSDDQGRVVKSGKERALEAFTRHIANLKGKHMRQNDYYAIQLEFEELSKAMAKNKQYLVQEGVPRPLVKMLVQLEDYVVERLADKAQFKKLSARQGRALNRLKLTLKKHNQAYKIVMDAYRSNPDDEDDDDELLDTVDDAPGAEASGSDSSSDSDSSDSDSSSSSSSSDSDSESGSGSESDSEWGSDNSSSSSDSEDGGAYAELKGRARWLKKNTVTKEKVIKDKEGRAKMRAKSKAAKADAVAAVTATKSILPEENLTPSILQRKVRELAKLRGRRSKDNRQLLRELEALSRLSLKFGPRIEIPILMHVIAAQFGVQRTLDDVMEASTWNACAAYLKRIANVLEHENYTLVPELMDETDLLDAGTRKMKAAASTEGAMAAVSADEKLVNPHTGEAETEDDRAERLRLEREANMTEEEKKRIPVVGSLSLHLTRLEEEYVKSLQKTSHHSSEYITRLRDESKLVELLRRYQTYFEKQDLISEAAALAQLRIEHLYYRHDSIAKQVDKASLFYEQFGEVSLLHPACFTSDEKIENVTDYSVIHPGAVLGKPVLDDIPDVDFAATINDLCTFVYKHGTDQAKTRSVICQVYHHALHDRFMEARDLLLMSHLQDTIMNCGDIVTMVMFNRMMVILGVCAFRLGRIFDAHQCLSDICSNRTRELLAQGVGMARYSDKSAEEEKAEKRRQVPYHQHINLDLLEACHLISAMLLEIPNMAGSMADETRRSRYISRSFRKYFDQYNHQVFTGPPEQTRDFVMQASIALKKGDWKTCSKLVSNLDVWQLVPGEGATTQIANMLLNKIKLEGLRTYLFAFSAQYDSLSLSQLCGMFEMTKSEVHSVVSKMMINRELHASWDQPTETVVLRKVEPSSLQIMALQYAEKAAAIVEANERLLDSQMGGYGHKDDQWRGEGDDRWNGNRGGGKGGRGGGGNNNRNNNNNTGNNRGGRGGGRGGGYNKDGQGRGFGRSNGGNNRSGRGGGRSGGFGRGGGGRSGGGRGSSGGGGFRSSGRGGRGRSDGFQGF